MMAPVSLHSDSDAPLRVPGLSGGRRPTGSPDPWDVAPHPLESRRQTGPPPVDLGRLLRTDREPREKPEPPCRVLLHNDDVTPIEYVPGLLHRVFGIGRARALWLTLRAHVAGRACVVVEPCARARTHVARAIAMARGDGHPHLRLSAEPEEA